MKLLVVGHTYVTPFAQAKYVAMKAQRPDLALRLVVPPVVHHMFGDYRPEAAKGLLPEDVVVMRSFGGTSNTSYLLDPFALASLMRRFAPTHVHVEEDPHSAVGAEASWLARRICPEATLSFFIWDNLNRVPRFPLNVIKRRLTRSGFARTRLVICGNNQAQSFLSAKGYHGQSAVIPQIGLNPPAAGADAVSMRAQNDGVPVIGYFGRLVPEKGVLDLLEALSRLRHRPWRLVIRGNGPLRAAIEREWRPMFGDRLACLDPLPQADVSRHLGTLDIFVLPSYSTSTWKEQFGLTLAQAMMEGRACVGSSSGAIPEVLGGMGVVFPERDVRALAEVLNRLMDSSAERARLGSAAQTFALSRYTSDVIARRHLAAFDAAAN